MTTDPPENVWDDLKPDFKLFAIWLARGSSPEEAARAVNESFESEHWNIIDDSETCDELKEAARREALELELKELEKRVKREIGDPFYDKWKGLITEDDKGDKFEVEVAEVFERLYCHVERTQRGPDGGYDLKIDIPSDVKSSILAPSLIGKFPVIVQCKSQRIPVDVHVIRELTGVVVREGARGGVVASLGGFTKPVEKEVLEINISIAVRMHESSGWKPWIQTLNRTEIMALDMESCGYSWIGEFLRDPWRPE